MIKKTFHGLCGCIIVVCGYILAFKTVQVASTISKTECAMWIIAAVLMIIIGTLITSSIADELITHEDEENQIPHDGTADQP